MGAARPGPESTGTRFQLLAVALAAGALGAMLGLTSARAAQGLIGTPTAWWGMSQLGSAVVCLTSGAGALGALWHTASAALALVALNDERGDPGGGQGAQGAALALLDRWGAPIVRRIAAGALIVGLSSSPAMAATTPGAGDDLGWQPTASATQGPSAQGGQGGSGGMQPASPGPAPAQPPDPTPQPPVSQPRAPQPQIPQAPEPRPAENPGAGQDPDDPGTAGPARPQEESAGAPSTPNAPSPSDPRPPGPQDQEPGGAGAGAAAGSASEGSAAGRHVVARGESLWSITAGLLPPGADDAGIARAWPVLYRANAQAIGPDPSLIIPGTVLIIPTDLPGIAPTTSPPG